jgi:hypothetical protein
MLKCTLCEVSISGVGSHFRLVWAETDCYLESYHTVLVLCARCIMAHRCPLEILYQRRAGVEG